MECLLQIGGANYCRGVAVITTCMLPLLSRESEVNTTTALPIGIRTDACHLFWRITGWLRLASFGAPILLTSATTSSDNWRPISRALRTSIFTPTSTYCHCVL